MRVVPYYSRYVYLLRELLAELWLRQVGGHDYGVVPSLGHLVQVVEYSRVTLVESHALREEHRGIAMRVEGEYALVQLLCLAKLIGSLHEPREEWQTIIAKPLRMPLHSDYRLVFVAFHCLNYAVGRCRRHVESRSRLCHCLVVERVDESPLTVELAESGAGLDVHGVGRFLPVGVLRMLYARHHRGAV